MIKKVFVCFMTLLIITCFISHHYPWHDEPDNIANKLIRFHVIANSDSPEDQSLKLKVRDRILNDIGSEMENLSTRDESEDFLNNNIEHIREIAADEILKHGKNYNVAVMLGKSWFPAKAYGSVALPPGEYTALKVVIGRGEGKNWWCVLFPPLCFVDITHTIADKETEEKLKELLNDEDNKSILVNSSKGIYGPAVKKPLEQEDAVDQNEDIKHEDKVEIKFKSVEIAKSLWSKIEKLLGSKK